MTPTIETEALFTRRLRSPLGVLTLYADARALVGVYFEEHRPAPRIGETRRGTSPALERAEDELRAYFADPMHRIRVTTSARGTALEQAVWAELGKIPRGETRSYGSIAKIIGRPTAARAVGSAVGRNPLSIVVPCHRVVGASGALTGFAGGLSRKHWLLTHEGALTSR